MRESVRRGKCGPERHGSPTGQPEPSRNENEKELEAICEWEVAKARDMSLKLIHMRFRDGLVACLFPRVLFALFSRNEHQTRKELGSCFGRVLCCLAVSPYTSAVLMTHPPCAKSKNRRQTQAPAQGHGWSHKGAWPHVKEVFVPRCILRP